MAGQSFLVAVIFQVACPMLALKAVLFPFCESQMSCFLYFYCYFADIVSISLFLCVCLGFFLALQLT